MNFLLTKMTSPHFLSIFHHFAEKKYFGIVQNSLERVLMDVRFMLLSGMNDTKRFFFVFILNKYYSYNCVAASNGNVVCKLPFIHFNAIRTVWI